MSMLRDRILPVIVALLLLAGCSGDRKAPAPTPPPQGGNALFSTPHEDGGSLAGERQAIAPSTAVRNTIPEIRGVRFVSGDGRPGYILGVEAEGYDADGDAVQFEIVWSRNGEPVGAGNRLTAQVKRGDKVAVTVTPFDGKQRGKSFTQFRDILNTAPVIEGQELFQVTDNAVTFHVRASDADGDPLAYSIRDAPGGMSVDRKTGWVRWVTSPGTIGKVPFTVIVSDGSGGESTARFTVTVAEQPSTGAR
jgi:hypothetical protein